MVQEIIAANPEFVYIAGAGAVAGLSILAYRQFSDGDEKEMLETKGLKEGLRRFSLILQKVMVLRLKILQSRKVLAALLGL